MSDCKRDVEKIFEKKHREDMTREEAINLGLEALNSVSEGKIKAENIDMITIDLKHNYLRVEKEEISGIIEKLKAPRAKE